MGKFTARIGINPSGYTWLTRESPNAADHLVDQFLLIGVDDVETPDDWRAGQFAGRVYDPFVTEPAVFRVFARLDGSPDGILAFVHTYGALWHPAADDASESIGGLRERIRDMRRCVHLLDEFVAAPKSRASRAFLGGMISEIGSPSLRAGIDERGEFAWVTEDLWSVMRLQVAEAITDRRKYRDCAFCGKPFPLSPKLNRTDRLFCSATCRVKTYYRRKLKARSLSESGMGIREIAKELGFGSDTKTVRKWLKEK